MGNYVAKTAAVKVSVGDADGPTIARIVRRGELIPEGVDQALLDSLESRGLIESVPSEEELLAQIAADEQLEADRAAAEKAEADRVAAEKAGQQTPAEQKPADQQAAAPTKRTARS